MKNQVIVEFRSPSQYGSNLIARGTYTTKYAFNRGHDRADNKYGSITSVIVISGNLNDLPYKIEKSK